MSCQPIDKWIKKYLKDIFYGVGRNSPYQLNDFVHVLMDAVEHTDFTNNTCVRIGGPTGETVFSRLQKADFEKIKIAFFEVLKPIYNLFKRLLRNRKVALAFDITDEPFYGKIGGFWIHAEQPVRGCTGCFKFLTISVVNRDNKLILGSLPVSRGADIVELIRELLQQAQTFVHPEILLFDRGFDNLELLACLQEAHVRYQILWRKQAWATKILKKMKRGEVKEVTKVRKYSKDKSKYTVKVRYVFIKKYRRFANGKAYDWVFATNTRQKSQHFYVDKYRKRWGIETVFRVLDNIQIKTTTKNEVIRYFINLFCCLVYNLWKIFCVLEQKISLKNFVVRIVQVIKSIIPADKPPD
ncbi:TPA: transposase [Candidatus Woesearchaeota archaeon]|nr:transposase [Candidatus Woesearchaeota archaeon]